MIPSSQTMLLALLTCSSLAIAQEPEAGDVAEAPAGSEDAYYTVDYLTPPEGVALEVGGMAFLPDGRLAVSTRRGQVWLVENPLAEDPADATFKLYAEGLQEGLGMNVVDGELYVVQRGELSRLRDTDGDDVVDAIDVVTNEWGVSGNYHEFAFGLPVDQQGNFYVGLNVSFFSKAWWHGKSTVPYRGWILRIAPDGTMTPVASGLRSPCGVALDTEGRLFVTDNQGDWVASSPIHHIEEGKFYGHPASLAWTDAYRESGTEPSDTYPAPAGATNRTDPAIWIPYKWSRSTGNLVPDTTGGKFGPFEEQLFVAELTNGMVLRAHVEEVRGVVQGAILPHRRNIGSVARVLFAPDGTLMCGMTNRGWGGLAPADGLARVRWTGKEPMELERISLRDHGFRLRFTKPLAADLELDPAKVKAISYDYDYWWEYGSPERDIRPVEVKALVPSADRLELLVVTEPLEAKRCVRMTLGDVLADDGSPLVHDEFAYTIRQLPGGPWSDGNISKLVPPPPGRESSQEGLLRLTYGEATDIWRADGWTLCDAEPDRENPGVFRTREGNGALVNNGEEAVDLTLESTLGDARIEAEFMLPEGGRSVMWIHGRYGIEMADGELGAPSVGTILGPEERLEPAFGAYRGRGLWHKLTVDFRAPRFDAEGKKTESARIERLMVDGTLLHEDIVLEKPSLGSPWSRSEAGRGPLMFAGRWGLGALRGVEATPRDTAPFPEKEGQDGWTRLFEGDEEGLEGWRTTGKGIWALEDDVLMGEGPVGHIFSPETYANVEVRARLKIADAGNSGLYFRTTYGEGWPAGYEAQVNSSYPDPQKTGSLYSLAPVKTHLVPPDTWFDYHIRCVDEEGGTRITIRVNGMVTADYLDEERRHAEGHIAFQQHHDGSVIEVKDAWVRRLD